MYFCTNHNSCSCYSTCSVPCPFGTYGSDCSGICQCGENGRCDQTDGTCECVRPGWTGIFCDQPCSQGYYGLGCSNHCMCAPNAECTPDQGWYIECSQFVVCIR